MPGVGLSEEGRHQAANLANRFADAPIAAVVSSPMQRAVETAAPVAERLDLSVAVEPGLNEIDFGAWTGVGFEQLAPDPAWQAWNRLRTLSRCPGGETMHAAQSRALAALAYWCGAYPDQTVLIVSHADILKALLAPALGLSLDHLHRITLDPASVSILTVYDTDVRVDGLNC